MGIPIPSRRKVNPKEKFNKGIIRCNTFICVECGKEKVKYANSKGIYCSNKCQSSFQHKEKYKYFLTEPQELMRANFSPSLYKKDIIHEQNGLCAICNCKQMHNDKFLVFILDHIDGDASNNRRGNLRCVCPNCDSQLDTYKSKNKNGSRNYYRYNKNNGGIIGMQG